MNYDPNYKSRTIAVALGMVLAGAVVVVCIFAVIQCYHRKRHYKQYKATPFSEESLAIPHPPCSLQMGMHQLVVLQCVIVIFLQQDQYIQTYIINRVYVAWAAVA